MKLAMCCLHQRMEREFPCLAIRHDDDRKATPQEIWDWAMSLDRKAREEVISILEDMPIGSRGQEDAIIRAIRIIRATIR